MRILIDCSRVNLWAQPSGISRVVHQYVAEGYRWAQSSGIEVIPVVPKAREVVVIYPVPGLPQPAYLQDMLDTSSFERGMDVVGATSYLRAHRVRIVMRRFLQNSAKSIRNKRIAGYLYGIDNALSKLSRTIVSFVMVLRREGPQILPGPGDVLFCPGHWHDVSPDIYRWIKSQGCDVVWLVHDILPISLPKYYSYPERDRFRQNVIQAFDIVAAFLCVSQATCKALGEFAVTCGKGGNFATAYNGYYELRRKLGPSRVTGPAFEKPPLLMVGSIEPKKGHVRVIEQLEVKWDSGYDRPLVIIGRVAWLATEITERIRRSTYIGQKLFWFQDFADSDLIESYHRCHALIFASLDEGFGLPMMEASMCRKPTIAYRTPIAEEVLGEFGVYFDDTHGSITDVIDKLENAEVYENVCAKLSNYNWPSWQERVTAVFDCLVNFAGHWKELPPSI